MPASKLSRLWILAAIVAAPAVARAAPLKVVTVAAPSVNCVFVPSCKLIVTDSLGEIPFPGITGKALLQSRTFSGGAEAPGAGLIGYEYRLDMTQAAAAPKTFACVTDVTVDFGPHAPLQYDAASAPSDVYVVAKGGVGTIGLMSAELTGTKITFVFSQPVCGASDGSKGMTSYFFGLASKGAPAPGTAVVGVPGVPTLDVNARAPSR